jgi:HEAT repeat protein
MALAPWIGGPGEALTIWPGDQDREREAEQRERERETRIYDQGRELIDEGRYDRAIERFHEVVAMKGARADAALYWKAWSQNKAGQRAEALTTISALAKEHPKSRYLTQARALEAEVRRDSGQPARPESESDDDLKLMALNALQNSDPEQAIPMLEKLLEGTASPKLKSRALFVLAQSSSPRAREVLKGIAKGTSTPELQNRAIDYLGQQGGRESRAALAEIYAASSDVDVKRRILRAFMIGGEKDRLLSAAQTEQNAELRAEAVQQLGVMGAHEELWQLYQKESAVDVKKRIIRAMFTGGNVTRMVDLARTEQNPELRRTAVANLGIMDSKRTSDALLEIYASEKDAAIRKTVIQGLFQQGNATALVALARKEQDPVMKKEIVQKLSVMGRNPVATAYMMELLNGK